MKTNFFKIVLPAFALMLAITASLAFTPANNEDATQKRGYIQTIDGLPPQVTNCEISDMCQIEDESQGVCTVGATSVQLFGLETPNQIPHLSCVEVLYKTVE